MLTKRTSVRLWITTVTHQPGTFTEASRIHAFRSVH